MKEFLDQMSSINSIILSGYGAFPPAARASVRLEKALDSYHESDMTKPLVVSLFGGTGVGKSTLFNSLTGIPEASPTSDGVRTFTKRPYIAFGRNLKQWKEVFSEIDSVSVDIPEDWGTIFIDTPDIDGIIGENVEVARTIVSLSDIVVYVASPEKYVNRDIVEKLRSWSRRKHWFFVMNRFDEVVEKEEMKKSFIRNLRKIGFMVGENTTFFTAAQTGSFDLPKLKESVLSERPLGDVKLFREEQFLLGVEYALSGEEVTEPIKQVCRSLHSAMDRIDSEVREIYRKNLERDDVRRLLSYVIRDRIWRNMEGRAGFFMAAVFLIRRRFHAIGAAFHMGRMLLGSLTIPRLLMMMGHTIMAVATGAIPVGRILERFDPRTGREIEAWKGESEDEVKRHHIFLEPVPDKTEPEEKESKLLSIAGISRKSTENVFDDIAFPIESAVEQAAAAFVEKRIGLVHRFFCNLLPFVVFVHTVFRLISSWIAGSYLPAGFYAEAVILLFISLVPGYLLLRAAVGRGGLSFDVEPVVSMISEGYAVEPIRRAMEKIEKLLNRIENVRAAAGERRKLLRSELKREVFGESINNSDSDDHLRR